MNLIALFTTAYLVVPDWPLSSNEWPFALIYSIASLVSILALVVASGEGWVSTYLRRKVLEEKKKIASLEMVD